MIAHAFPIPAWRALAERSLDRFFSPFHPSARCQGPDLRAGVLPRGSGAGGGSALFCYPAPRPAGSGSRRSGIDGRDRGSDWPVSAFSRRARAIRDGALWDQRDVEDRCGGARDPQRTTEGPCRDHGRGGVRRAWPKFQIWAPDRFSARLSEATGKMRALRKRLGGRACGRPARSTGMMTGRDGGNAVDGGLARHIPVLASTGAPRISAPRDDGIYIDGTFGAGG